MHLKPHTSFLLKRPVQMKDWIESHRVQAGDGGCCELVQRRRRKRERGWQRAEGIKEQEGSVINPLSLTNRVQFPIRHWLNEKKWEGTEEKLKCPKRKKERKKEREREREREERERERERERGHNINTVVYTLEVLFVVLLLSYKKW